MQNLDPKSVDIYAQVYVVEYIAKTLSKDYIIVFDTYTNEYDEGWSRAKASRFIESLILKIPTPMMYMYIKNGEMHLIDGRHRFDVLRRFIAEDGFTLDGLEYLPEYNDKKYSELPAKIKRRINECPIICNIIPDGTDQTFINNMVQRIRK